MKFLFKQQELVESIYKMRSELMAGGLTSKYIAESILGVCAHTLSNICNNRNVPNIRKLRLYAIILSIEVGSVVKKPRKGRKKK